MAKMPKRSAAAGSEAEAGQVRTSAESSSSYTTKRRRTTTPASFVIPPDEQPLRARRTPKPRKPTDLGDVLLQRQIQEACRKSLADAPPPPKPAERLVGITSKGETIDLTDWQDYGTIKKKAVKIETLPTSPAKAREGIAVARSSPKKKTKVTRPSPKKIKVTTKIESEDEALRPATTSKIIAETLSATITNEASKEVALSPPTISETTAVSLPANITSESEEVVLCPPTTSERTAETLPVTITNESEEVALCPPTSERTAETLPVTITNESEEVALRHTPASEGTEETLPAIPNESEEVAPSQLTAVKSTESKTVAVPSLVAAPKTTAGSAPALPSTKATTILPAMITNQATKVPFPQITATKSAENEAVVVASPTATTKANAGRAPALPSNTKAAVVLSPTVTNTTNAGQMALPSNTGPNTTESVKVVLPSRTSAKRSESAAEIAVLTEAPSRLTPPVVAPAADAPTPKRKRPLKTRESSVGLSTKPPQMQRKASIDSENPSRPSKRIPLGTARPRISEGPKPQPPLAETPVSGGDAKAPADMSKKTDMEYAFDKILESISGASGSGPNSDTQSTGVILAGEAVQKPTLSQIVKFVNRSHSKPALKPFTVATKHANNKGGPSIFSDSDTRKGMCGHCKGLGHYRKECTDRNPTSLTSSPTKTLLAKVTHRLTRPPTPPPGAARGPEDPESSDLSELSSISVSETSSSAVSGDEAPTSILVNDGSEVEDECSEEDDMVISKSGSEFASLACTDASSASSATASSSDADEDIQMATLHRRRRHQQEGIRRRPRLMVTPPPGAAASGSDDTYSSYSSSDEEAISVSSGSESEEFVLGHGKKRAISVGVGSKKGKAKKGAFRNTQTKNIVPARSVIIPARANPRRRASASTSYALPPMDLDDDYDGLVDPPQHRTRHHQQQPPQPPPGPLPARATEEGGPVAKVYNVTKFGVSVFISKC